MQDYFALEEKTLMLPFNKTKESDIIDKNLFSSSNDKLWNLDSGTQIQVKNF